MNQDTQAVIERLDAAVATSGLFMRQFAHALGTSASRFSSYRSGKVSPSAPFLLRAERIANALGQARRVSVPTAIDAIESIRRAEKKGDDDWTYALSLEARDRLRDILRRHRSLAAAWEAQPPSNLGDRWKTLVAAFVSHEFIEAGLPTPKWADAPRLNGWLSATSSSLRRIWSPCDSPCPRAARARCGDDAGCARPDVDAVASRRAVIEEARAVAEMHGLAERWLNNGAEPWVPPRPESALRQPTKPGLTVHIAPPDHVLAMKLVALRRKDRPDIRLLIAHLGMAGATPQDYADLLARVYCAEGQLATVLNIPGDDEPAGTGRATWSTPPDPGPVRRARTRAPGAP